MNVYEAAKLRIEYVFDNFDNVIISFSGGKDSGVLAELAIARARKIGRRVYLYHLDYEGMYTDTINYVHDLIERNLDVVVPYWVCLPLKVNSSASFKETYWRPWEDSKKDLWIREMPDMSYVINENNHQFNFDIDIDDYSFNHKFMKWFANSHHGLTADLIGLRSQESLSRYSATHDAKKENTFNNKDWTTKNSDNLYSVYPIFDWKVDDIWIANAKNGWKYNKLYDLMYQAGLKPSDMRVASPYLSEGQESLSLYKAIEPNAWGKVVGRVNGANFVSIYAGTSAMGAKNISIPEGQTWKSYVEYLLTTLPNNIADNYRRIFRTSIDYWTEKGGALSLNLINDLEKQGVSFKRLGQTRRNSKYTTPSEDVVFSEYPDDVEDIKNFAAIPTYKRMAVTILKNDHQAKYMGFGRTKSDMEKRKKAMEKYANIL